MRITVGSDHAGRRLRTVIAGVLIDEGHEVSDVGTDTDVSVDYPHYAERACRTVANGDADVAILVCGTGIGMSMAANKIRGIRAALCSDEFSATMARRHNNANVLCLGERVVGEGLALGIVHAFIGTSFEGGRHARRVEQIAALESKG